MPKYLYPLFLLAFAVSSLCSASASAQEGKGIIVGTVKDSQGAPLQGALVEIQPISKRVKSDSQGQFRVPDLPVGDYTVTATYVGLSPFTQLVKVGPGQEVDVNGVLNVASQSDQVVVTAEQLQGEAEAINIERTAENIVQVLPANVITSLPNTNIADAVGRLPSVTLERDEGEGKYVQIRGTEPRLSNVTIDGVDVPSPEGNVRNIKLDIIPSDLVDRIEVNKTLSANQDADAIGGTVNLVTKSAAERPTYTFFGEGGYTPIQGGRPLSAFGGTVGRRFGESKRFGALLGGSYDFNGRGIDDLEPSPGFGYVNNDTTTAPVAFFSSADLRTYTYNRTRYGFEGGFDYKLGTGSNLYLKGLYSDFHDFGDTWVYTYNAGSTITSAKGSQLQFSPDGSMQYRHYIRRPDQQIFSVLTGGRHDLGPTLITYDFAVSRAHSIGGYPTTFFNNAPSNIAFGQDLSDPYRPKFPVLDGTNLFDPAAYSLSQVSIPVRHSTQFNVQGTAALARRYSFSSHYGSFELGLKIRNAHKPQIADDHYYNPTTANIPLTQVLGTYSNPSYYDRSYQFGPLSNYGKITTLFNSLRTTGFSPDLNRDRLVSDPATYDVNERVYAGYLMNTVGFGKFTLQGGLRIEATDANFNANIVILNTDKSYNSTKPTTGGSNYVNVLPSVQLQYMLGKNTNLRLSYGRGLSRPNFQDIVPSQQVFPNNSPKSVQLGNPGLKPTRAHNYDVLIEHFFQPLGILQAGFFYKQLSDPIYPTTITLPSTDPNFPGYQVQQPINGPNAHIAGFEAAWEQRLSRLPGLLSGFGVAANYSYTTSAVTFPAGFSGGRTDHPHLQRQAPNTWNLGMTYDKARFSMRFGVSHNDANIFFYNYQQTDKPADPIIGIKGPTGDLYLYAHTQIDVQGSYRMHKGLHLVVYGLNLSNEVFGFYQGSPIYPVQREYYHPTIAAGLRWSSAPE